jgi:hypothetical protein
MTLPDAVAQHDPARVEVGALRSRLATHRLGREIAGGAEQVAGLRQGGRILGQSDAEVDQLGAAVWRDQDVLGLDVPVHDSRGMNMGKGAEELPRKPLAVDVGSPRHPFGQVFARDVLHDEIRAFRAVRVVIDAD